MTPTIAVFSALVIQAARANLGYDQSSMGRWSWLDRLTRAIVPGRACDCSALTMGLYWLAGYPVDISGTCYTGNAAELARAAGFQVLPFTSLSDVREGDALLTPGHHIVPIYRDTDGVLRALSAEYNEHGTALGGKPGDQNGREVRVRDLYVRPGGWTFILRPPADAAPLSTVVTAPPVAAPAPVGLDVDGCLGRLTITDWQEEMGTDVDGVISKPRSQLVEAVQRKLNAAGARDWDGRTLTVDGIGIESNDGHRFPTGKTTAYPLGKSRTVWALQVYLGIKPDGVLDASKSATIEAVQRKLNAGAF